MSSSPAAARLAERAGWGAFAAAVAWGAWQRVEAARASFLFGDEFHTLDRLALSYRELASTYDRVGSGLALPLLQRLGGDLLGPGHLSLRGPALLGSLGALLAAFLLGRRLGGGAAAAGATLLLAGSPFHVFYGHFARIYGLVSLGALLLLSAALRLLEEGEPGRGRYLALAGLSALVPWLHLSAAGFVAGVDLALLALVLARKELRPRARPLLAAGAGAALLAAALYLPALGSMVAFVREKTSSQYDGVFGLLDVAGLLAGSALGGRVLLGLAVLAALGTLRGRGAPALLLASAVLVPPLALYVARPYGDAYAYARYLMPSATVAALWLAHGVQLLFRGGPGGARALAALVPAAALLAAREPLPADGPYANTYLSLRRLPAFDQPWPERSPFYQRLAGRPVTIIEVPALRTRSRQLYREAFLEHHARTLLGFLPGEQPAVRPAGPYVWLGREDPRQSGADYLVVHVAADLEAARYWDFVYSLPTAGREPWRALMERQRDRFFVPRPREELLTSLRALLGRPAFADETLLVWDLHDTADDGPPPPSSGER